MEQERLENATESRRRLDELSAQVVANQADIAALLAHADEATQRAHASEGRADGDRRRIDELEARAHVDRELITELQADGLLNREHAAHLKDALSTSRKIGAAIGIVMANRRVSEAEAFDILSTASQRANLKLRVIAEEVVYTGDLSGLPGL
jgi:AmiR/NasT family two-component response regulator